MGELLVHENHVGNEHIATNNPWWRNTMKNISRVFMRNDFNIILPYVFTEFLGMDCNSIRYWCTYFSCAFASESHFNLVRHELMRPHKKHYPDTVGNHDKTIKKDHDRQPSGLEWELSDMICQRNGSPTSAAEGPTINE